MRLRFALVSVVLSFCSGTEAVAQQPTRLIVPYPAGGTADILARMIVAPLAPLVGQTIIVVNQPGAAGTLGASAVARAEPDGRTLLFTNTGPSAIAPAMSKKPPYDAVKDFAAVSLVARSPLLLMVSATLDVKDLHGFIAYAKANAGAIEYSSPGVGSFTHLATEQFAQSAGLRLVHVPYKGQAPAITAVVANEVKMSLTSPSGAVFDMARAGKLRLLGVSSRDASSLAPGVPPIAQVLNDYATEFWFGIVAPAKTSDAVIKRLHEALQTVLADPAMARQMQATGSDVAMGPLEEFKRLLIAEAERWREVVRTAKIEPEN